MVPAFERMPATEAVATMLPLASGFSGDVCIMAGTECLAARKTLWGRSVNSGEGEGKGAAVAWRRGKGSGRVATVGEREFCL